MHLSFTVKNQSTMFILEGQILRLKKFQSGEILLKSQKLEKKVNDWGCMKSG